MMFLRAWLDVIFPPFCAVCSTFSRTTLLCPTCWEQCTLIQPEERCRHCFVETEGEELCSTCRKSPLSRLISAGVFTENDAAYCLCKEGRDQPEAIAAFAIVQWSRLGWPIPDVVLPFSDCTQIAKAFAHWLDIPCMTLLQKTSPNLHVLQEDWTLFLMHTRHDEELLHSHADILSVVFPKKIYALSLLI